VEAEHSAAVLLSSRSADRAMSGRRSARLFNVEEPLAIGFHELGTALARVLDACEQRFGRSVG
jgi:hypothetical protein